MTVFGANVSSLIENNRFEDNDTQGDPMLGGSGISISGFGENEHLILNNEFFGNLWGITLLSNAMANLGDTEDPAIGPGGNSFDNNENGGITYALYNNTENPITAHGNCWIASEEDLTLIDAESVIFHQIDDPALGEVFFDPLGTCEPLHVNQKERVEVLFFPNPTRDALQIQSEVPIQHMELFDLGGRSLRKWNSIDRIATIDVSDIPPGIYILTLYTSKGQDSQRLSIIH
jgi:hypothetical protein